MDAHIGTISSRYSQLDGLRGDLDQRCEQYAKWTIPSLWTTEGTDNSTDLTFDYQSIGARAISNIGQKIASTILPASLPFFRIDPHEDLIEQLAKGGLKRDAVVDALGQVERQAPKTLQKLEASSSLLLLATHLAAFGNGALYYDSKAKKFSLYSVRNYVCVRDMSGGVQECIFRDNIALNTLPTAVIEQYQSSNPTEPTDAPVVMYTRIIRESDNVYRVSQAVGNVDLVDYGKQTYSKDKLPWQIYAWSLARGRDYGVGRVEEYAGDFNSLSTLSEALTLGAAVAADLKFLVDPAGSTKPEDLNSAETGEYVYGRKEDIQAVTVDKVQDWSIVQALISAIEKRIGIAFLLNSAVTRDAERVTAAEIRLQAQELDGSLNGLHGKLAETLQPFLARIAISEGKHKLPTKGLELYILTGMLSLSRTVEAENTMQFLEAMAGMAAIPESVLIRIDLDFVMSTIANGLGLDKQKIVRPAQEVQAEMQQRQQQQAQQVAQQQAAQTAGKVIENREGQKNV